MRDVLSILRSVEAIVSNSHFVGTSGRHFGTYINKDALTSHTRQASQIGQIFANKFKKRKIDVVVSPAVGGIPLSQWTAYHLSRFTKKDVLSLFTEKTLENNQILKRGYDKLVKGKRVLVVEDVTTTGGSVKKVIRSVKKAGGKIIAASVMINRDPKVTTRSIGAPFLPLSTLFITSYNEKFCPFCKAGIPVNTKLGHGKKFLKSKRRK